MAHHNTLFANMLAFIPRHVFEKLERRHKTGRSSRKFGFREQFTVMAFLQLAGCASLRNGIRSLAAASAKLYHWGLRKVALSTAADANAGRPVEFFKDLFGEMYNLCQSKTPRHRFNFNAKLYSLDATVINLCLSLFPWASFRQNKGGIKMHAVLDHDGCVPAYIVIKEAKKHEINIAKTMAFPKGSIVVFDRGYNCYAWFKKLCIKGIYFVTRLKNNAGWRIVEKRKINRKSGVRADHIILLGAGENQFQARRVEFRALDGHLYTFLTNNFDLPAETIAAIYKARWDIELFFKEIKQNLKIKHFVGNSLNAVMIQIYTALTVYLLLAYFKFLNRFGWSIGKIIQVIRLNLLCSTTLEELLLPKPSTAYQKNNSLLSLIS